ncbi:MAG: hypothetical protein IT458_06775 [Planctomycetes bacterium]|nr:hypothetical protein [Planctomycetota bacterium]
MDPRTDREGDLELDLAFDREGEGDVDRERDGELTTDLEGEGALAAEEGALGDEELLEGELDGGVAAAGYLEGEDEYGEEPFFKPFRRRLARFARRAAPLLKQVARVAAPRIATLVGTAFGGPLGATLGASLGRVAANALRESDPEFDAEEPEMAAQLMDGELLAALAARAPSEAESEALSGAAVVRSLSPATLRLLRHALPHMVRATSLVARLLYQRSLTRPAIRVLPAVVRSTARVVAANTRHGSLPSSALVARVMAHQTARHLGDPNRTLAALAGNARAAATARRRSP